MITAKMLRRMLGVVLVTASLVACGGDEASGPKAGVHNQGGADAFNASLVAENVIADVTVDPARVGTVLIHMEFAPPGGKLDQVLRFANATMPRANLQTSWR
ncbi:MAG: hypothetical protein ACKOYI_02660, partial [Actinomycetota bacterium]